MINAGGGGGGDGSRPGTPGRGTGPVGTDRSRQCLPFDQAFLATRLAGAFLAGAFLAGAFLAGAAFFTAALAGAALFTAALTGAAFLTAALTAAVLAGAAAATLESFLAPLTTALRSAPGR